MRKRPLGSVRNETLKDQLRERYGVTSDPFAGNQDFFYHGAGREELVSRLVHTLRFSEMLPLITGEKGIGKTVVLAELIKAVRDEFKVVILKSTMLMNEARFLELLFTKDNYVCPHPIKPGDRPGLLKAMTSYLENKQKIANPRPNTLIVIDDSDDLAPETLGLILEAQHAVPIPISGVRFLMAAQSEWVTRLSDSDKAYADNVYQIPLMPFGRDDTERYVKLRLRKAGATSELLLSAQQIDGLVRLGKGIPGRINRVAAGVLLGLEEPGEVSASGFFHRPANLRPWLSIVAAVFLSVLAVAWLYRDEGKEAGSGRDIPPETTALKSEPVKAPVQRSAIMLGENLPDDRGRDETRLVPEKSQESGNEVARNRAVGEAEPQSPSDVPSVSGVEPAASELVAVVEENAVAPESPPPTPKPQDIVVRKTEAVTDSTQTVQIERPQVAEAPLGTEPSALVASETVSPPEREKPKGFRDSAWVGTLDPKGYVVQLLGSYNEATAQRFLKQYPEIGAYYIRSTYKGKPWFIVLDGPYPSKQAARAAVANYPSKIRKQNPWPRSVRGIQ